MRKPIATFGVLGLLLALALATPRQSTDSPRMQPAASVVRTGPSAANGRPWYPIGDTADDTSWYHDPIGRMSFAYRMAKDEVEETNYRYTLGMQWNVSLAFINITGVKDLDIRGFEVMDASTLKTSDPALYNDLDLASYPGVQQFAVLPDINEEKPQGKITNLRETLHAEQMNIFQNLSLLHPSDGGAVFTPERFFEVYTDNSPCSGLPNRPIDCADVMPANTRVLFAVDHGSTNYSEQRKTYLDAALALSKRDPQFAKMVVDEVSRIRAFKAAMPDRLAKIKVRENRIRAAGDRLFRTYPAAATATSAPCAGQELGDQAGPCASASASANSSASSSATGNSFSQALAQPMVAAPGGIDFSRIQLDYLSDPGDGSGLQYAFGAPSSLTGGGSASGAMDSADLASAAFFVWLELDPSADWVNLNPTEPDRIVDAQMGRTDVGRIMLQADLALKKDVGTLIYPNSALGKSFWSELEGGCFASRVWVVPSPAQVYTSGDKFYILKAPLDVKMEADYLQMPKGQTAAVSCPKQDAATQAHNESLYRSLVLPKLVSMVNTDPSFADLRTIYRSRVAAEWYRNLSESKHTTYADLIDQDDISQWTTTTGWSPEQTFQQYVTSYSKGEWHVTSTVNKGDYTYEYDYTYGGVDLTSVPIQQVSSADFAAADPSLAQNVSQSLSTPTTDDSGTVMFGSPTPLEAEKAALAAQAPTTPADGSPLGTTLLRWLPVLALILLPSTPLLPLAAIGFWGRESRLRKRSAARNSSQGSDPPEPPKGPQGPTWA